MGWYKNFRLNEKGFWLWGFSFLQSNHIFVFFFNLGCSIHFVCVSHSLSHLVDYCINGLRFFIVDFLTVYQIVLVKCLPTSSNSTGTVQKRAVHYCVGENPRFWYSQWSLFHHRKEHGIVPMSRCHLLCLQVSESQHHL